MRRLAVIFGLCLMFAATSRLFSQNVLKEVEVWGKRPMKEIGVEKTAIDSLQLKENIALSLADILTYNTSLFVKSHGKASLSTVSFRGTSASHTQVTWNGMRINNPMLGMTDFSTIPSFFVDKASLLHGSSSLNETGGALGGVIKLETLPERPVDNNSLRLRYVQGMGSFSTFDEFFSASWLAKNWSASTRVSYSSSPNDFKYVNHDKKENIYDDNHNIVGQYHPVEKNRSGAYKDFNIMQQVYGRIGEKDRIGLNAWYINSNRELPMLTTDYGDERQFENRQREQTFRGVASWNHYSGKWTADVNAGYAYTQMAYDYRREISAGHWAVMTRSRSYVNTLFARGEATWYASSKWLFSITLSAHQHFVRSRDRNVIVAEGTSAFVGYNQSRLELSGAVSARWQPVEQVGLALLAREESFGSKSAFIPAFFFDALLWRPANLMVKASVSRNHRFPSLNDLYFLPGGNPNLRDESGLTYDAGFSAERNLNRAVAGISANWFDSYIDDWIIWLPTTKGFFSPRNVKKVHAYGIESRAHLDVVFNSDWSLGINGSYSWTPSVNRGEKMSDADMSVGRQLPYVPRHSASLTGRLTWHSWSLLYKWAYYSKRFTMSSNDLSFSGYLPDYFMNNLVVQKDFQFRSFALQFKLAVNNLFNEDYLSVLSRPMPGINFEFFVGVTFDSSCKNSGKSY